MIAALLPYRWMAVALLAAAAVGYIGILRGENAGLRADLARKDAATALELEKRESVALAATERARLEDQRRTAEQREATDESQRLAQRARSDAAGAATERERVLVAAAGASRRRDAAADPAATVGGPATDSACVVQAELLSWATGRAVELGEALDAAHIAGQLCERSYDALTGPVTPASE